MLTLEKLEICTSRNLVKASFPARMRQVTDGNEDVPEEVMPPSIFTLKELSEIIPESTKSKMLAANPNLERMWQFGKV